MGYLLHGYLSLGGLEVPTINGLWFALSFLVGLLGGSDIVGFISNYYKERKEKRAITRLILSEIELNQNRLKPLVDSATTQVLGNDKEMDEELFPNELNFYDTINSDLSDKLRLLNEKNIKKAIVYYSELKYIEEMYKKSDILHGFPSQSLAYLELREINKNKIPIPEWQEIKELLRHTKNTYDLGEELIISLKEN